MSDMSRFFTREKASEGRKVQLADPATGKLTEHWIVVRSRWCDEFQEAKGRAMQQAFTDAKDGAGKEAEEARKLSLVASLVGGWSFEEPCTPDAVMAFLREAPQIVEQIDRLATKDSFFFRSASDGS